MPRTYRISLFNSAVPMRANRDESCRSTNMYEVELKFRLIDPRPVIDQLVKWGAAQRAPVEQRDVYFRHPQRDFAQTDEALRVRSVGEEHLVTYKGPVIDSRTKTRREIEVALANGTETDRTFSEILQCLGFEPVRCVKKLRTVWALTQGSREFEIALDDVTDLGTFLEIETLAGESERAEARDAILALAGALKQSSPEPKSYLALLLNRDAARPPT